MSDTIFTLPEADRSLEDIIETCCSQETVELKTCIQLVIAYILTFYDANSQIPIPVRNIYALMGTPKNDHIALRMALDLPVTATLVRDIIHDTHKSDERGDVLEFGSGTGILGLATYIQACRQKNKSLIIGIEEDQEIAARANALYQRLHIGHVHQGNSTDQNEVRKLIRERVIRTVINENLGQPGKSLDSEPFLENLWGLHRIQGGTSFDGNIYPFGIKIQDRSGQGEWGEYLDSDNHFMVHAMEKDGKFYHRALSWTHLRPTCGSPYVRVGGRSSGYYGYEAQLLLNPELCRSLPSRWIDYTSS